jgi:hypothetical protein
MDEDNYSYDEYDMNQITSSICEETESGDTVPLKRLFG